MIQMCGLGMSTTNNFALMYNDNDDGKLGSCSHWIMSYVVWVIYRDYVEL
jgi:hypothetical protein